MTTLSPEEKEQVAVLLGWRKWMDWFEGKAVWRNERTGDETTIFEQQVPAVTLEACMEYAKGKGWGMDFTYWRGDQKYTVELHNADDGDIFAESIGDADHADPLTAFVRALLKAEATS